MPRQALDAFATAVKLLAGRERTTASLERALEGRGFPPEDVARALARARELGYLDESRAAKRLAQAELKAGRARADVRRRLEAKGVSADEAARSVEAAALELGHDDLTAAQGLLAKRRLTGPKAARLLLTRGFDEDLVARLVPSVAGFPEDG